VSLRLAERDAISVANAGQPLKRIA
jgi:hypothetical protein